MSDIWTLLRKSPVTLAATLTSIALFRMPSWGTALELHLLDPHPLGLRQLLGCHLLHWSAEHLAWDLGMFCLLGILCERKFGIWYYAMLPLAALAIPLSITWLQPTITSYRGLSGIDTALFCSLAVATIVDSIKARDALHTLLFSGLLLALFAKVAWEFNSGATLFVSEANFVPLPLAHLVGGLSGGVVAAGFLCDSAFHRRNSWQLLATKPCSMLK